jgi:uncharacterized glyoxalase superfamily protein PhnB
MSMKRHILAALREEFHRWKELLAGMSKEQITAPCLASGWSIKDVVAHLWAWQQRSIARLEAARLDKEPEFPAWPIEGDPDVENSTDGTNAWIYETNRQRPWSGVYRDWREGFLRLLQLGEAIAERDLLDAERYSWMDHSPLALVLVSSYEHHHLDHLEPLLGRLGAAGKAGGRRRGSIDNRSMPPGTIIPELAYADLGAAVAWLCDVFGFRERLRIGDHRSQLVLGGESLIVVARSPGPAPAAAAAAPAQAIMVRVLHVDRHYERARQSGARILQPPETYPYGERQYTVEDIGGHYWTFSQSVADVAPEEWGGAMVEQ